MRILFLDSVHPILEQEFQKWGFVCDHDWDSDAEKLSLIIHQYEGIVVRGRIVLDSRLLKAATHLRFIARSGSGLENIDLSTARQMGIAVVNSPEGNRDAVAEHTLGMLLMLFNNLHKADREVRAGIWDREGNRGIEIMGKTLGIIGFGVMGQAVARRFAGFGVRILAFDKYRKGFGGNGVWEATLSEIFNETDILSFHVPLTPETRHYFNADFLKNFRRPIWLLNTSRGAVVSLSALADGLRGGKVLGACLDVLETERHDFAANLKQDPHLAYLLQSEKVVFSPHVAGWTIESYQKLSAVLAQKLIDLGFHIKA
jgi:D-3-phosphoglycerate dehydrogenase